MSFAIDVNILLYASDAGCKYYKRAKAFLDDCIKQEKLFFLAWPTVMGYLRIATHPSIFGQPLTPDEAMANIGMLLSLPHIRFLSEEEGFWDIYREMTAEVPTRGNLVPDAHLAAILRQHGVKKLYSHDRDFLKFAFLDVRDPIA
ncbi:MAG: type II toxin-antitoxin system VapC family toxin [Nitrospirota bacterium]|nr:type II toxin-antitoxin system VapC family toxin [Nitrospirota bacterium]